MTNRANRLLTIVFAILLLVNVMHLLAGFASIPLYLERVTTLAIPPHDSSIGNYLTNEAAAHNAAAHSMTLSQYAVTQVGYHSAIVGLCLAVALLIVWRAGWNWFAWYSAFFLVFIAGFAFYDEVFVARLLPLWLLEVGALFWPLILLYFYLFPNGKPVPRRALWVIGPVLLLHLALQASVYFLLLFPRQRSPGLKTCSDWRRCQLSRSFYLSLAVRCIATGVSRRARKNSKRSGSSPALYFLLGYRR